EMIAGPIPGTATLLNELRAKGLRLFALSNWSLETFPLIRGDYPELNLFERIFLSGEFHCAKPDRRFYEVAISAIAIPRKEMLFVDDNQRNVDVALQLGLPSILFRDSKHLRRKLRRLLGEA